MSRSSNSLRISDVVTTPIKLKYTSSYDSSSLNTYGITVLTGVNGPVTSTGSVPQQTLNYRSIRQLFYSNYLTGSMPTTTSSFDDSLQSTAAYGTLDVDYRNFPTESNGTIKIISIPRNVFGEKISRQGFSMTSSLYEIMDDGNGNIKDVKPALDLYILNGYFDPNLYFIQYDPSAEVHVGNIIYAQGFVIITNPDYLGIFDYIAPTTTTSTTTAGPTTTSTSTSTTTAGPTTTSTSTSTTTAGPTTTTSTTTAGPTTTSTSTSTTTVPATTTSTTTVAPTTTSTTTSTTTATPTTTSTTTSTTTVPTYYYYTGDYTPDCAGFTATGVVIRSTATLTGTWTKVTGAFSGYFFLTGIDPGTSYTYESDNSNGSSCGY